MSIFMQSEPLYKQAYDVVKKSILSGKIKPGERIVATKLAEEYQISRTPLREALRQLANEGLLVQDQVSTRVMELNRKDFEDLIQCRLILERELIRIIVHTIPDKVLDEAEQVVLKAKEALKSKQEEQLVLLELNTRFHEILIEACPNKHLTEILNTIRAKLLLYRANVHKDREIQEEHQAILYALKERDEAKAVSMIEWHLEKDLARGMNMFKEVSN